MRLVKFAILLSLLGLFSCAKPEKRQKPLLLASIHPYELILSQLVGSEFEVKSIIPAGASPHTWSPGPSDLTAFADAQFILSNGLGLETGLDKNFATKQREHVAVAELLKETLPEQKHEQGEEAEAEHEHAEAEHEHEAEAEHHHTGPDPHLWTSPLLMSRLIVKLEKELSQRFPNSSALFKANSETMRKELATAVQTVKTERLNYNNPGIVTYHNSFHYFCEEFGIESLGWVQASPGKEPTPKELKELGDVIKEHGVKAIFIEPQMDKKAGEVLAKEFGLKLLILDPLGSDGKAKTIAELLTNTWNNMKESFTAK